MKKIVLTSFAILGICSSVFADIIAFLDTPNDDSVSVSKVLYRDELRPIQHEYGDIMVTRIWLLENDDVTNVFGPKLETKPDSYALPLFVPHEVSIEPLPNKLVDGTWQKTDWRDMDYYAVGNSGYVQFYYDLDNKARGVAALYLRTDDRFVPLQSTNDFARRLDWEKVKLSLVEKWLDDHLPKMTDLGVVEVSSNAPSRVALGNGKTCLITAQVLNTTEKNNDWFTMALTLDTTNAVERDESRNYKSVSQPGESIGFKMAGKTYRLTPKLKKP